MPIRWWERMAEKQGVPAVLLFLFLGFFAFQVYPDMRTRIDRAIDAWEKNNTALMELKKREVDALEWIGKSAHSMTFANTRPRR